MQLSQTDCFRKNKNVIKYMLVGEERKKKYHIQPKSMGSQDRSIFWYTLMEVLFKTYVQNYS